jgi:hypothetical protein
LPDALTRSAFAIAVVAASVFIHLGLLGMIVMAERRGLAKPEIEIVEVELVKPDEVPVEAKQENEKKKEAFKLDMPELQKPWQQQLQQKQQQKQQASSQSAAQSQSGPQSRSDPKAQQQAASTPQEPPPDEPAPEEKPATPSGGPPSETKAKLTAEEIAAFRAEIQKCWELPIGIPDAMKLEVVLRVALSRKGGLFVPPELLKAPASVHGPRLVGIAMKAIQQCAPYKSLPVAKYNEWKVLDLRFLATGMAGLDTTRVDVSKLPRG